MRILPNESRLVQYTVGHLFSTLAHLLCPIFGFDADEYGVQMLISTLTECFRATFMKNLTQKGSISMAQSAGQVN